MKQLMFRSKYFCSFLHFFFFPSLLLGGQVYRMKTPHLMCSGLGQVPALGADSFTTMLLSSVVFLVVYINYTDAVIPLALPVQLLLNSLNRDSIPAIHISA